MHSLLSIEEHVQWWGLQPCETEDAYEQWQRAAFSKKEILELHALAERKSASRSVLDEIAFYNYSVRPSILPVLYSQRYFYYRLLGPLLLPWVQSAGTILDFGCGPGILTTYLAQTCPNSFFVGIDRSPACIRVAQEQAERLQLCNIKFDCVDIQEVTTTADSYEMVLSCQALLQSEQDPGIPSQSWKTFTRSLDSETQSAFEQRTGLSPRLDQLMRHVEPSGKILLYEKVGHVGRRIPFQRALASRGLQLLQGSNGVTYQEFNKPVDDGPFYVMARREHCLTDTSITEDWNEVPAIKKEWNLFKKSGDTALVIWKRLPDKHVQGKSQVTAQEGGDVQVEWGTFSTIFQYVFLTTGAGFHSTVIGLGGSQESLEPLASQFLNSGLSALKQGESQIAENWPDASLESDPDLTPLYENHTVTAQEAWSCFQEARILNEFTKDGQDGRQIHIELGEQGGLCYLYCANTFDQRQLVVIERERSVLLEEYYQELFHEQINKNSIG